jgi:hypothetical protein
MHWQFFVVWEVAPVEHAIELDEITTVEIAGTMKAITGLDNPNSVVQMKGWCSGQMDTVRSFIKRIKNKELTAVCNKLFLH